MNIVSKYLVQPVKKFFARRKLHYLGFTQYRCQFESVIFNTSWDDTKIVHYYASENGKKKIKGAGVKEVIKICAVTNQWYHDPDIDPFSLVPGNPSEFSKKHNGRADRPVKLRVVA